MFNLEAVNSCEKILRLAPSALAQNDEGGEALCAKTDQDNEGGFAQGALCVDVTNASKIAQTRREGCR